MKEVLVTIPVSQEQKEYLESKGPGCHFKYRNMWEAADEEVQGANVIIGGMDTDRIRASKNLEWIQLRSAGSDHFCQEGILAPGTLLSNATGAFGPEISEYMLGAVLLLYKNFHLYQKNQEKHLWKNASEGRAIQGATTLVIGLGDIGGTFARKMHVLGSRVIGVKRNVGPKPDYVDQLYTTDGLDEALPQADIVAISLPNTPETRHIIDERRLALMKPTAILINVGRGTSVDTDALCRALTAGRLGGCVLDVTEPEPLPEDHPLWDAPNTVITPHVSGLSDRKEIQERIIRIAGENLERFLAGKPLINEVDFATWYRKNR